MKLSELIEKLQKLKARSENDFDVYFTIHDYYTRYGSSASMLKYDPRRFWEGTRANGRQLNISLYLDDSPEGKKPKITFRKKK